MISFVSPLLYPLNMFTGMLRIGGCVMQVLTWKLRVVGTLSGLEDGLRRLGELLD